MADDVFSNPVETILSGDELVLLPREASKLPLLVRVEIGALNDVSQVLVEVRVGQLEGRDAVLEVEGNRCAISSRAGVVLDRDVVTEDLLRLLLAGGRAGRPYTDQIKPANFLLVAHVAPGGYPTNADPEGFTLIAPYEPDPHAWE
jgi:hypothetical protein